MYFMGNQSRYPILTKYSCQVGTSAGRHGFGEKKYIKNYLLWAKENCEAIQQEGIPSRDVRRVL